MHVPACSRLPKAHPRPRPCSHSSNLPCSPSVRPVPAADSACLALHVQLKPAGGHHPAIRAADTPRVPTSHSQAVELALPGHRGHVLGPQCRPFFSSLTSCCSHTWASGCPSRDQEHTNFCLILSAQVVPPCLDSSTTLTCTGPGPAGPLPFQGSSWLPHHPLASLPPQCPLSNLDRTSKSTLSPQESL